MELLPAPPVIAADFLSTLAEHGVGAREIVTVYRRQGVAIHGFHTPIARHAIESWRVLHSVRHETHLYPVIVSDVELLNGFGHNTSQPPSDLLKAALDVDLDAWVGEQQEDFEEDDLDLGQIPDVASPAISDGPSSSFVIDQLRGHTWIALVPVTEGHEVPAHIASGGWNNRPTDPLHITMLRRWNERYDAHLIAMQHDTVEVWCASPPASAAEIGQLAIEQCAYCLDILELGESVLSHARSLAGSTSWYFWWD